MTMNVRISGSFQRRCLGVGQYQAGRTEACCNRWISWLWKGELQILHEGSVILCASLVV